MTDTMNHRQRRTVFGLRKRRGRRWLALLSAVALSPAIIAFAPADAHAVTCYGDYCSGKDPEATGCSAGAVTSASARIPGTNSYVELRWSAVCKTNWTRTTWYPQPGVNTLSAVQQNTNYTQSGVSGSGNGYYWTRMIYSPNLGVSARFGGPPGSAATAFA